MCNFGHYIFNSYIRKSIFVSCGKCRSCLQQKANARALRIRNHNEGKLCLFVTLTYSNEFVPYVISEELLNLSESFSKDINVYRDADVRYYNERKIITFDKHIVETYNSSDFENYCYHSPFLNKKSGCTGVILFSDFQRFIKRLRVNLKRTYNYEEKISYFAVGEYGASKKSWRPHFHCLLYFPEGSFEEIQSVIAKSWSYGDMFRQGKRIQVALDPSGYVASYVTKSADLPKILQSSVIRQKHSHSLYFGVSSQSFSLNSLLEKADRHDLSYCREVIKDGKPMLVSLPVPKYAINRFFPKFKGYSSFAPSEIHELLLSPKYLWNRLGNISFNHISFPSYGVDIDNGNLSRNLIGSFLCYTPNDFSRFVVRLRHCVDYYIRITGKTIFDYAIDYSKVWFERFNYIFKHSYDEVSQFFDFYENIIDFVQDPNLSLTLPSPSTHSYQINPNLRKDIVLRDFNLSDLYGKRERFKAINSEVLSSISDEF